MDLHALLPRHGQDLSVDIPDLLRRTLRGTAPDASPEELLDQAVRTCAGLASSHPDHDLLAGRLAMASLHGRTPASFRACVERLHARSDREGNPAPAVSGELLTLARRHEAAIQAAICSGRDFDFDLLAVRTFE